MSKPWEYISFTHRGVSISSFSDFTSKASNPGGIVAGMSHKVLAMFKDSAGVSNLEKAWSQFKPKTKDARENFEKDLEFFQSDSITNTQLENYTLNFDELPVGTNLALPLQFLVTDVLSYESDTQIADHTQFSAFIADRLEELYSDEEFRTFSDFRSLDLTVREEVPQATVIAWVRSLSSQDDESFQGKFVNITSFVNVISTSVNSNGGNFSIDLSPTKARYESEDGWVLEGVDEAMQNFYTQESIGGDSNKFDDFFENVLNRNDMIFVSFEPLQIDEEFVRRVKRSLEVPRQLIPTGTFDMIGLIDSVFKSEDPQTADERISIVGRDLVKLLIDDGCWFFPYEFVPEGMIANQTDERWLRRHEGRLVGLQQSAIKSIQNAVQFVFNALSNISICPDEIFAPYGDQRTTVFSAEGGSEARGVWQIIKLLIDEGVTQRRIADTSIGNELGSMMNFIRKICQDPWVEFFSDTYGNQFYFIIRQPPFSKKLYTELATRDDIITIKDSDLINIDVNFDSEDIYSWYRIQPQPLLGGAANSMGAAYLKAVHFPEYAEIWGDNAMDQVSNYIPYWPASGQNEQNAISDIVVQGIRDLQYLVQSNAYNPFVRSGQITINGDRRIKYGTVIYVEKTGEVFYVDNVSHSLRVDETNIDRVTNINVSRGMVLEHLDSYFEIINTEIDEQEFARSGNSVDWSLKVQQNWKVNRDIFSFFLRREQFS